MNFDRRLDNHTCATTRAVPMDGPNGEDLLLVAAKVTLAFEGTGELRLDARPIRAEATLSDRELLAPSDLAPPQPGTDVGVVGTIEPPRGVSSMRASVTVDARRVGVRLRKEIEVFGPRVYQRDGLGICPGPAAELQRTKLSYSLAYGGTDIDGRRYPFNPIGLGFAADEKRLVGTPAPRLVPSGGNPSHGCFGPLNPTWEPRLSRIGTLDEIWERTRNPLPPEDAHPRSESWAVPELSSEVALSSDAIIELAGFHARPVILTLPLYPLELVAEISDEAPEATSLELASIWIDMDEGIIELVHRAHLRLPLRWESLKRMTLSALTPFPGILTERTEARMGDSR